MSPAGNKLGWLVVLVPMIGGLVIAIMARYGSERIPFLRPNYEWRVGANRDVVAAEIGEWLNRAIG